MKIFSNASVSIALRIVLYLLLVVGSYQQAYTQEASITTRLINWQTSESVELHSGEPYVKSCLIVTDKNQTIDLVCGNEKLTFNVEQISGSWSNPLLTGSLTYSVSYQEMPGKIIISRTTDQVSALFDFTQKDKKGMKRKFIITEIN